jgi:DNA-binding CsgD family transcriptional regulator
VRPLDLIGAIELAYDRTQDDTRWLADLASAIAPAFSPGPATTAFFFDVVADEARVGTTVSLGESNYTREHYAEQHRVGSATGRPSRVVYDCDMFTLLSRVVGAEVAATSIRGAGMVGDDALGLRANTTHESGVMFTTHVPRGYRIRQRGPWTRFAAHVGSALRLRRSTRAPTPESALAVLGPRGRVEHGAERAIAARDDLASAAQDMDRARGKLRRLDADAATALWRAMVKEEWTLVDWVDHDGKRFLLVEENRVPVAGRRALTERERQVVACAAMGHSNKLIAYDLGLSTGTVSVVLSRAAQKLGVSGRVALIRAFRELAE